MSIKVIGISGKAGSGKDYISQNFLRPHGYFQWSFAWHFKNSIVGKGAATYEEVFHTKPPHIRKELQLEGTERGRNIYGENIWCETAKSWMLLLHEQWGINKFVVADVRFPNEVEFIKTMGGNVLRINAPIRIERNTLSAEARLHVSETALDDYANFDYILDNDPEHANVIHAEVQRIIHTT